MKRKNFISGIGYKRQVVGSRPPDVRLSRSHFYKDDVCGSSTKLRSLRFLSECRLEPESSFSLKECCPTFSPFLCPNPTYWYLLYCGKLPVAFVVAERLSIRAESHNIIRSMEFVFCFISTTAYEAALLEVKM